MALSAIEDNIEYYVIDRKFLSLFAIICHYLPLFAIICHGHGSKITYSRSGCIERHGFAVSLDDKIRLSLALKAG